MLKRAIQGDKFDEIEIKLPNGCNRSLILYLHTKGMRNSGEYSADWRRYMSYFLVEKKELCLEAIIERGFDNCGVELSPHEFEGNMWWSSAGWIAGLPGVASYQWNMANRYEAEDFLLKDHSVAQDKSTKKRTSKSFCLFHIPHNLYDCPTPRKLYANESYRLSPSSNCYVPSNIVSSINAKGRTCYTSLNP